MLHVIQTLNYLAVFIVAAAGFIFGWLWYSPLLFGNAWKTEMKITEEKMKECAQKGMAKFLFKGFLFTLLSSFGLAVLFNVHCSAGALKGAEFGAFVGLFVVGMRILNGGVWEQRSCKLQAINIGHEIVLFALQGALLSFWR